MSTIRVLIADGPPRFRGHSVKHENVRGVTPDGKTETTEVHACIQGGCSASVRARRPHVRAGGGRPGDLTKTALRDWVKRAEADVGTRPSETLTSAEREELQRLRVEGSAPECTFLAGLVSRVAGCSRLTLT